MAGLPVMYCLNILARTAGWIFRIDHSLKKPVHRIIVCKLMGMGSILQTVPMLYTLKNSFPQAKLVFLTTSAHFEIVKKIPPVDEVILLNDRSIFSLLISSVSFLFRAWRKKTEMYFDLEMYSCFSTILSVLSLSVNRFGYYRRAANYKLGIYTHMMYFNTDAPVAQVYLQLCRIAGCKEITGIPSFLSNENVQKDILKIKEKYNIKQEYIVINPNASPLLTERKWLPENFVALISKIFETYNNIAVVLIGSKTEEQDTTEIAMKINTCFKNKLFNLSGKTDISELITLISGSQILVSNDSGPMHIGIYLKKKTIGLFGPCSPFHYGTDALHFYPFYEHLYCSPCIHHFVVPPCKGDNRCMKQITTEKVFSTISNIMKQGHDDIAGGINRTITYMLPASENPLGIVVRA